LIKFGSAAFDLCELTDRQTDNRHTHHNTLHPPWSDVKGEGKVLPYSLPSVGHGVNPGVQAVSTQVTLSHPPGGRLTLLSARPAVTFPAGQYRIILLGDRGTGV